MSNYIVSASPHIRDRVTSQRIMLDVIIALVPALIAAIAVFGLRAALVVFVCVATCVLAEFIWQKLMKKTVSVGDLTAVVTGILLAYNLPVNIPLWQAMVGAVVAIIVVKQLFGGVGKNFANPAITARIVMFLAFSVSMTNFVSVDGVSSATPLALITAGRIEELPSLTNMLLGVRGGCLGETSVIALVIGGVYLICRKVITWHTPVVYLATVFVFTLLLGQQPVYQVMSGGLMLGAIFMATDYVTTPYTAIGKVIFGLGAGILTVIIRVYGSYAEGVSYSILLMNILTPYINRIRVRLPVGGARA
ncbi:MAG: RnfABCDGE type electron transport complex subunit D [Oscillospiraceae bacterium]|nr:RnfABCDGE type electron transport complex subunit D [Oscillospiraceae bacterium]MBQ8929995.1 RnfABCDGE type electron transport complex subunit D [Oscillospiraceae bacterium]